MLFFLIFFRGFYFPNGFVPRKVKEKLESKHFQLINPNNLSSNSGNSFLNPINTKPKCKISVNRDIYLYKKSNTNGDQTIFLEEPILQDGEIINLLFNNGFAISTNFENQDYILTENSTFSNSQNYEQISLFPYLNNLQTDISIYSDQFTLLCPILNTKNLISIFVTFFVIVFLVSSSYLYISKMKQFSYDFFILDSNFNLIFGKIPEFPNDFFKKRFYDILEEMKHQHDSGRFTYFSLDSELPKSRFYLPYLIAVRFHNLIFVFKGKVYPPKDNEININVKLNGKKAENIKIERLNDQTNISMHMKIDGEEKTLKIPSVSLAPLYPGGRTNFIFNSFVSMISHDSKALDHSQLIDKEAIPFDYFVNLIEKLSNDLGILRVVLLSNEQVTSVVYQYSDKSLENLSDEQIYQMKNESNGGELSFNDCAVTFTRSHQTTLAKIEMVVGLSSNDDLTILQVIYCLLLHIYQLTENKEKQLRFERILNLLKSESNKTGVPPFSLYEVIDGKIKTNIGSVAFSPDQSYEELMEGWTALVPNDQKEKYMEWFKQVREGHITLQQELIPLNYQGKHLYQRVTSFTEYVEELQKNILMVFSEDVTELKEKEMTLHNLLNQLEIVYKSLGLHKFEYNETNGKFHVPDEFFTMLHLPILEDNDITPRLFHDDVGKLLKNTTIRILDGNNKPTWFSVRGDGSKGFIFCSDDIMRKRNELSTAKFGLGLNKFIPSPYCIFLLNPEKDCFQHILKYKTPYDLIGIHENNLSKFTDFILDGKEDIYKMLSDIKSKTFGNGQADFLLQTKPNPTWFRIVVTKMDNNLYEGFLLNIDEQKKLETALVESLSMRDIVLQSAKLIVWTFSNNSKDIPVDISNMNWKTLPLFSQSSEFKEALEKVFKKNSNGLFDEIVELENNVTHEKIWYSARGKRSEEDRIIGILCDITELHRATTTLFIEQQRAEQALNEKTMFLQSMAHGIRTPMNGIVGMLDMLSMQQLSVNQRLVVDILKDTSLRLLQELNAVLQLSKVSRHDEIPKEPLNMLEKAEPEMISTYWKLHAKGHKLNISVTHPFPIYVEGASHYFRLIINDLLENIEKTNTDGSFFMSYNKANELLTIKSSTCPSAENDVRFSLLTELVRMMDGQIHFTEKEITVVLPEKALMCPYIPVYSDGKKHIVFYIYNKEKGIEPAEIITQRFEYYRLQGIIVTSINEFYSQVEEQKKNKDVSIAGVFFDYGVLDESIKTDLKNISATYPLIIITEDHIDDFLSLKKPLLPRSINNILRALRYEHLSTSRSSSEQQLSQNQEQQNVETQQLDGPETPKRMKADAQPIQTKPKEEPKPTEEKKKLKILVVEDFKANQIVMSKILQKIGVDFDVADNGQIAVDKVANTIFDMIFMDCQMPVMDGLEATREIRNREKEGSHVPIVALTASAVDGDEDRCIECGMDGYMQKPVRYAQIAEAIKKYTAKN